MRKYWFGITFVTTIGMLIAAHWVIATLRLPGGRALQHRYYRLLCAMLRVRVQVVGEPARDEAVLIVGNHASWLDIPVIGSVAQVTFVAKREVANWPLIGSAAKAAGTIFIDRTRRQQTANANAEIANQLVAGRPVMLFAEGTSSDGNRVLQFRSALFGAVKDALLIAPDTQLWVQPMSICYMRQHGLPLGRHHRPLVAWYGDLDFLPHLTDFLTHGAIDVVVTFGEPIPYGGDVDRKAMVKTLEHKVRQITSATLRGRPHRAAA
jgi:1-acyl-sn-glycerol-3-phosphate acyltransferase